MTEPRHNTIVLRDADGSYYLLTPELLERARVTADQQADLEQRLGEDDTAGFAPIYMKLDGIVPPVLVQNSVSNTTNGGGSGFTLIELL